MQVEETVAADPEPAPAAPSPHGGAVAAYDGIKENLRRPGLFEPTDEWNTPKLGFWRPDDRWEA